MKIFRFVFPQKPELQELNYTIDQNQQRTSAETTMYREEYLNIFASGINSNQWKMNYNKNSDLKPVRELSWLIV